MPYRDSDDNDVTNYLNIQTSTKEAYKQLDNKYEHFSIPFNGIGPDGKFHKKMKIEQYGSGSHGSIIRNAVTGLKYDFNVGSIEEDLLFKVSDSTGRYGRKEPLILYYDNPEQYEEHHFLCISDQLKTRWNAKYVKTLKQLSNETDSMKQQNYTVIH